MTLDSSQSVSAAPTQCNDSKEKVGDVDLGGVVRVSQMERLEITSNLPFRVNRWYVDILHPEFEVVLGVRVCRQSSLGRPSIPLEPGTIIALGR